LDNYVQALIRKHRANGVLVDTNLMVLLLVGRAHKRRIREHKRTSDYTVRDYDLLEQLIAEFQRIVTTPHVLTEISNLIPELAGRLKASIAEAHELWGQSVTVIQEPFFLPFGLTDAAISMAAAQDFLVLTSDARLFAALQGQGRDASNLDILRGLPRA